MNSKKVTIVDYGASNLYNVMRAFQACGAEDICISSEPANLIGAERVVLPGVGAFADGMQGPKARGLDEAVRQFARSGRPLLGICLGMQLFAIKSDEFGEHSGLGLIPGDVEMLSKHSSSGKPLKMPFVGWEQISQPSMESWEGSLLEDCGKSDRVYLIHSFEFKPQNLSDLLAIYHCEGKSITAAVQCENITGLQFHPEKSGAVGISMLATFLNS
jgi:glutamine amidotransferase